MFNGDDGARLVNQLMMDDELRKISVTYTLSLPFSIVLLCVDWVHPRSGEKDDFGATKPVPGFRAD
jgi:hypothetical protein